MVKQFIFNHYEVNTYLIIDEATRQCAIVDPAMEASYEDAALLQHIEQAQLEVVYLLLTHAHTDHIAGLRQACEHWKLPITMHPEGRPLLKQAAVYGSVLGFAVDDMGDLDVNEIEDNAVIQIGETAVECRYVPGHCPGSMCFVVPAEKVVLTGDALFHYSIGRTDLIGGDYQTLINKIKTRLLTLDDDYRVLPGHGIASAIGKERRYNPFLQ